MSIRLRLAMAFAAAAAALFAIGGWLFASALSSAQLGIVDSQLTAQLAQAARYLPGSGASLALPATASPLPGEYLVQVVDSAGRVRGASHDAGQAPLVATAVLSQARQRQLWLTRTIDEEDARVTAAPLTGHPGWVALAAVSLESYNAAQREVARGLAIGGGIFVIAGGLGAYALARAALSPVERLRRQVAAISAHDDSGGVAVPRTRDELAALAGTMNDLLGKLRRALDRERALVADASHELRSPLAVLRGELELAARPGRSQRDLAEAVHNAAAEADRLGRLTDDLLLLARGDAGGLDLRLERTDLAALCARSASATATRLAVAQVTCQVDVPPGTLALVDADRVRQAVDNLLGNALRFAPAGSAVVVAAWREGTGVRVEVRDSGPGFPPEFLPHAFERFRRPDGGRSRDGGGGAGLGLAIVRAIAVAHGGDVAARNAPEGGAVVSMWLPGAATGRQPP